MTIDARDCVVHYDPTNGWSFGNDKRMLQTRQSLGTTSLSMAAQAGQSILRLLN